MTLGDLMTVTEAAEYLGMTARQVRNYIKSQDIKAVAIGPDNRGKRWMVDRASVEAFKQNRKENPPRVTWKVGRKPKRKSE